MSETRTQALYPLHILTAVSVPARGFLAMAQALPDSIFASSYLFFQAAILKVRIMPQALPQQHPEVCSDAPESDLFSCGVCRNQVREKKFTSHNKPSAVGAVALDGTV